MVDDVAAEGAELVAAELRAALERGGAASLALSGGSTPLALYGKLVDADLDWARVHVFWGDERLVPPDDPESNYHAARESLLRHVPIPEANIHRVQTELDEVATVADYAEQLRAFAQADPDCSSSWPLFDVALLGLGADGHFASVFPGSEVECLVPVMAVDADYEGRPARRVTLTPLVFNAARHVVFLVTGGNKAAAVANALGPEQDPERFPAQRIQPEDGRVTWLLDSAAAAELE